MLYLQIQPGLQIAVGYGTLKHNVEAGANTAWRFSPKAIKDFDSFHLQYCGEDPLREARRIHNFIQERNTSVGLVQ